jgi:hypothetical protein
MLRIVPTRQHLASPHLRQHLTPMDTCLPLLLLRPRSTHPPSSSALARAVPLRRVLAPRAPQLCPVLLPLQTLCPRLLLVELTTPPPPCPKSWFPSPTTMPRPRRRHPMVPVPLPLRLAPRLLPVALATPPPPDRSSSHRSTMRIRCARASDAHVRQGWHCSACGSSESPCYVMCLVATHKHFC